jgi:hypothetical protein
MHILFYMLPLLVVVVPSTALGGGGRGEEEGDEVLEHIFVVLSGVSLCLVAPLVLTFLAFKRKFPSCVSPPPQCSNHHPTTTQCSSLSVCLEENKPPHHHHHPSWGCAPHATHSQIHVVFYVYHTLYTLHYLLLAATGGPFPTTAVHHHHPHHASIGTWCCPSWCAPWACRSSVSSMPSLGLPPLPASPSSSPPFLLYLRALSLSLSLDSVIFVV